MNLIYKIFLLTIFIISLNASQEELMTKLDTKTMEKNLINLNDMMINSKNMIDYLRALTQYSKILSSCTDTSSEMISIFKNNPPPNKSIYFEKVKLEKEILFTMIDNMNDIDKKDMKNYNDSDYKKLMTRVKYTAKDKLNTYFSKMTIAIKSESKLEIENFNNYINNEEDNLLSTWSQIKLLFHTMLAKFLHIFIGYNKQFDYMADYIGEILAITAVPKLSTIYEDHIKMQEQYQKFLHVETIYN